MTSPVPASGDEPQDAAARRDTDGWGGRDPQRREAWRQLDQSSLMTVELLTGVLTWGGIGWLLDRWLGTGAWFTSIGTMIGLAAGLYLVWLRSTRQDAGTPGGASGAHDGGEAA
jgi:F0F1-type ATP synthase assembly protein I